MGDSKDRAPNFFSFRHLIIAICAAPEERSTSEPMKHASGYTEHSLVNWNMCIKTLFQKCAGVEVQPRASPTALGEFRLFK